MKRDQIQKIFQDISGLKVLVIGDVMLDKYYWGHVDRMSPEAPVPVVSLDKKNSRLGGAANVAMNCIALGAKVMLASVIGSDTDGQELLQMLEERGINSRVILSSPRRTTTSKTRIMSKNVQMLRLDDEMTEELSTEDERLFLTLLLGYMKQNKPDVVIFEDYNKGVMTPSVISKLLEKTKELGCVTAVDPKLSNFLAYQGVTIFKPNLKEVREGLNLKSRKVSLENELKGAHKSLKTALNHEITFITLSEQGVYYNDGTEEIIPTIPRKIVDVSGAGDTTIAVGTLVYAVTKNAKLMAQISNLSGGLVCEIVGVVPIDLRTLQKECESL